MQNGLSIALSFCAQKALNTALNNCDAVLSIARRAVAGGTLDAIHTVSVTHGISFGALYSLWALYCENQESQKMLERINAAFLREGMSVRVSYLVACHKRKTYAQWRNAAREALSNGVKYSTLKG